MLIEKTVPKKHKNSAGFSLIEIAIGLMILGILMVPLLDMYKQYRYKKMIEANEDYVDLINTALYKYVIRYGRYPRPAEGSIPGNGVGEGTEIALASITFPCVNDMTTVCETNGPPNERVYIGVVPFAEIGLPKKYSLDGYNRRFTYAVTKDLTETATFSDTGGKIKVIDKAGGDKQGTAENIHYIVISHGANGKGTTTNSGVLYASCSGPGKDIESCDNDKTFNSNFESISGTYDREVSEVAGPNYYDDYIGYATTTAQDIWAEQPDLLTPDLYNRKAGNIRVGAWGAGPLNGNTDPEAQLDIAGTTATPGHLKANQVQTNRLCTFFEDESGTPYVGCTPAGLGTPAKEVFAPVIIGGDPDPADGFAESEGNGIYCGEKGLKGIAHADEQCGNNLPVGILAVDATTCGNPGWAGRKVISGVLICESP